MAGVIVPVTNVDDPGLANALRQTEELIAARADDLAHQALADQPAWLAALGSMPDQPRGRAAWQRAVASVAAYRERHSVTSAEPLGPRPSIHDHWHARDRARAARAIELARALSGRRQRSDVPAPVAQVGNVASQSHVLRL